MIENYEGYEEKVRLPLQTPLRIYQNENSIIGITEDFIKCTTLSGFISSFYDTFDMFNFNEAHTVVEARDEYISLQNGGPNTEFDIYYYVGTIKNKNDFEKLFAEYLI